MHGFAGAIHRRLDAVDGASKSGIDAVGWASQDKIEDHGIALGCTRLGIIGAEAAQFAIRVPDANACRSGGTR